MCFEKVSVSNSENCYFAALASPSYWSQGMSFFYFVLSLSFLGWNKMEWDKEAEMALH